MCFGVENPFFERQVIPGTEEQPEIFECFCQPEALLCVVVLYNLVGHILSNPNVSRSSLGIDVDFKQDLHGEGLQDAFRVGSQVHILELAYCTSQTLDRSRFSSDQ